MDSALQPSTIDIIIPVYRGLEQTRACIASVLGAPTRCRFELILVDDASPEPELSAHLDSLAGLPGVTLLRNESNIGFVRSVNRGMAFNPQRDVLLLNSDTLVANDWLDRLLACAAHDPRAATVSPFSNNATICSYPNFCQDNPLPADYSVAQLDRLFAEANAGLAVEIPTAVGSCMLIRRACLGQIGEFDAQAFGRGYGEECDFCQRAAAAGWRHLLCGDVFIYHEGRVSFGSEQAEAERSAQRVLAERHPDYSRRVADHLIADPASDLRRRMDIALLRDRQGRRGTQPATVEADGTGQAVQLHVLHELGGGIERWWRDFCSADRDRRNLALRPLCEERQRAVGLALYDSRAPDEPLRCWVFEQPIVGTSHGHVGYRQAFREVLDEHLVGAVLVSSLIGHDLAALDSGIPTVVVQHDFHPLCPAINSYFDGLCPGCPDERLIRCSTANGDFNLFPGQGAEQRLQVRRAYLELLQKRSVPVVVPSHSVAHRLRRILPEMERTEFVTIPHGQDLVAASTPLGAPAQAGERLRIVVLGTLAVSKGLRLLEQAVAGLTEIAELHLVGAGELGELFADHPQVKLHPRYEPAQLTDILGGIRPHLGMLLSVWPETYSYTLTELISCGIPPLATRLGAFAERIRHDETGFLCEPDAQSLLKLVRRLASERARIDAVRERLALLPRRSAAQMVADFHLLLPLAADRRIAPRRHPEERLGRAPQDPCCQRMLALNRAWKENLRLDLERDVARRRLLAGRNSVAARLASLRGRAEALEAERNTLQQRLEELAGELEAMRGSTSWRVSAPVRWLGRQRRRLSTLARLGAALLRRPAAATKLYQAACCGRREYGLPGVRLEIAQFLTGLAEPGLPPLRSAADDPATLALEHLHQACAGQRSALLQQSAELPRQPLISVIMPTFETPEALLVATLDALRAQIYPHWELCVADDGSTRPHVRRVLNRYAALEPRIRIAPAAGHRGVSATSNRALAMARGEFCILLDHDDLLEPHALLRVAQSVVADDPDLFYSDEALVSDDASRVLHFALRPAFSPEYLRSHPYIVHLVGFRTALLRSLGGWDETLGISQDYDLILRASERARRIAHQPEVLYRWRIHGNSAGHARMHQVMETSRRVLERHLARCGAVGSVAEGRSFNFFETRYRRTGMSRVAIVIPTHNHAELVRACVESVERTCAGLDHRIVLVDHASDAPEALTYFDSLGDRVLLLRQQGTFNFARINNRAVADLPGGFTHFLFLNNDVEALDPGWLEAMLELAELRDVGAVGALLHYPDGRTVQHAGVVVAACGIAENLGRFRKSAAEPLDQGYMGSLIATREVSAVTAACLLMRAEVFAEIGGFDESLAVGYGDVDLCLRLRDRGYRVLFCPRARLLHHESYTRGRSRQDPHPEDSRRFRERWQQYFADGDPYFSPNFDANSPNWQFARPLPWRPEPARRVFRRNGEAGSCPGLTTEYPERDRIRTIQPGA